MQEIVFYHPGSWAESPHKVAAAVWEHLYEARDRLDAEIYLVGGDEGLRRRCRGVTLGMEEAVGLSDRAVFYFPISPILGLKSSTVLMLRLRKGGARMICDYHGDLREDLHNHMRNRELDLFLYSVPSALMAPIILNWHECVVLHSRYLERIMRERYDLRTQTHIIPNGIDREMLERVPETISLKGDFNLFYHGRHAHEKGLDLLIDAVSALPSGKKAHLYLAGRGPQTRRLREQASRHGVSDRVHFLGYPPLDDVLKYLASVDLVVHPSRFDNFPVAVLEAMAAARCPVLFSDRMGIGEFMEPAWRGKHQFPLSVASIRERILDVMKGRMEADDAVMRQRSFAREHTWDKVIERYLQFFNGLG